MCDGSRKKRAPGATVAPRGVIRRIIKAAKKGKLRASPLEFSLGLLEILREKDFKRLEAFGAEVGAEKYLAFMVDMQKAVSEIVAEQKKAKRRRKAA